MPVSSNNLLTEIQNYHIRFPVLESFLNYLSLFTLEGSAKKAL